jgi:hypothetical protein
VICELARVLRAGGRLAALDIVLPEHADSDAHNRIERTRDPSHVATLRASALRGFFEDAGLRIVRAERRERARNFNTWMDVAGWPPGSEIYAETRRLMEASGANDAAGFRPEVTSPGELQFTQAGLYIVAEKK